MEDLQSILTEKLQPFLQRIQVLEDQEKQKDIEIITLKHAIANLHSVIENLKQQQESHTKSQTKTNQVRPQTAQQNKPTQINKQVDHEKPSQTSGKKPIKQDAHDVKKNDKKGGAQVEEKDKKSIKKQNGTQQNGTQQNKKNSMVNSIQQAEQNNQTVLCQTAFGHYLTDEIWIELDEKLPWQLNENDKKKRDSLFDQFDPNGNGLLSHAEAQKGLAEVIRIDAIVELQPVWFRAFEACKNIVESKRVEGDDYIERAEFRVFLFSLIKYLEYWVIFNQFNALDSTDRKINLDEFKDKFYLLKKFGYIGNEEDQESLFKVIDENQGGEILFDEFCHFAEKNKLRVRGIELPELK